MTNYFICAVQRADSMVSLLYPNTISDPDWPSDYTGGAAYMVKGHPKVDPAVSDGYGLYTQGAKPCWALVKVGHIDAYLPSFSVNTQTIIINNPSPPPPTEKVTITTQRPDNFNAFLTEHYGMRVGVSGGPTGGSLDRAFVIGDDNGDPDNYPYRRWIGWWTANRQVNLVKLKRVRLLWNSMSDTAAEDAYADYQTALAAGDTVAARKAATEAASLYHRLRCEATRARLESYGL